MTNLESSGLSIADGASEDRSPAASEAEAIALLEQRDFEGAARVLKQLLKQRASSSSHALLGIASAMLERYDEAAQHFSTAVQTDGVHPEYSELLSRASANAYAKVDTDYPPSGPFDRNDLLAEPSAAADSLPAVGDVAPHRPLSQRARKLLGRLGGRAIAVLAEVTEPLVRTLPISDEVWTNWYRRPVVIGLLALSRMRDQLNRNNLKDCYPEGELTAFQSRGLQPPPAARYYRTADGSWNNPNDPKEGAAGVRLPRNLNRAVTFPRPNLLTPNPAEISQVLLARDPSGIKEVPFLNLLAAAWIQFMIHDWVSHRLDLGLKLHELELPPSHPARVLYRQTKMLVPQTAVDPTRGSRDDGTPPTYINEVTSWWDASQIYGSDAVTAARLRSRRDGKLRLDGDRLPIGQGDIEETGFNRNWWLGLSMLHTLFAREHNAICDMLRASHPTWNDDRIYNVARLINAAVIAKIHTVEWTPAILPNRVLNLAMNANWCGLIETVLRRRTARRVFRTVKVESAEFGGIVGNPVNKHGSPYGLSEEFTEVYRLHELLPDELVVRRIAGDGPVEHIDLIRTRQSGAHKVTEPMSLADMFYSFGNQHPGQLVLNNYPNALRQLSIPGNPVYDLAAVDILRARERGVPRYNEFRRQLGLKPIRSFEDLTADPTQVSALRRIYENDIEAIDLLVGTRAESQRPTGFGFGETMFQIFILNASRRLQADRFYTDSFDAETYTREGLEWIDRADLRGVLLRHYPELASTGLMNVDNAFEPWDTGALDASRHPLRAFA